VIAAAGAHGRRRSHHHPRTPMPPVRPAGRTARRRRGSRASGCRWGPAASRRGVLPLLRRP
jgi:hypothetical protein